MESTTNYEKYHEGEQSNAKPDQTQHVTMCVFQQSTRKNAKLARRYRTLDRYFMKGNKLISLQHLRSIIQITSKHLRQCLGTCDLTDKIRSDLGSTIVVKCDKCNRSWKFLLTPKIKGSKGYNRYSVNYGGAPDAMVTGGSSQRLNESFACVGAPGMSHKMLTDTERQIGNAWEELLVEEVETVEVGEKEIAIGNGQVLNDKPWTEVTADAGWSHQSHGHRYNAKSGVGVVFGKNTGKVSSSWCKEQIFVMFAAQRREVDSLQKSIHVCGVRKTVKVRSQTSDVNQPKADFSSMIKHTMLLLTELEVHTRKYMF